MPGEDGLRAVLAEHANTGCRKIGQLSVCLNFESPDSGRGVGVSFRGSVKQTLDWSSVCLTASEMRSLPTELFSALISQIRNGEGSPLPPRIRVVIEAADLGALDWSGVAALVPPSLETIEQVLRYLERSESELFANGGQRGGVVTVVEVFWREVFKEIWEKPSEEAIVRVFWALGNSTRWKILQLLENRPRLASEMLKHLRVSKQGVSQHLVLLKEVGLVREELGGGLVFLAPTELARKLLKL